MKKELNAFTLIELLVVCVICVTILAISTPMFFSMGKGMALRGGTVNVKNTLLLCRQHAITHRVNVGFYYYKHTTTNKSSRYYYRACEVDSSGSVTMLIQQDTELPSGVIFDEDASGIPWHMGSLAIPGQTPFGWLPNETLKVGEVVWNNSDIIRFNSTGGLVFSGNPEIHLTDINLVRNNPINHNYNKIIIGWLTGSVTVQ